MNCRNNTRPARSLEVHGRCSKQFSGNGFRICNYNGPMKEKEVCLRNFISSYKFYLAFENANCEHYITEKMFRALYAGAIPVVFGARYSDYVKIAPPFSFIYIASPLAMKTNEVVGNISSQKDPSIRDINQEVPKNHPYFHSNNLEELANYLLKLDSDDKLNDKYHAWRKEYEIVPRPDDEYLCQICQHLHLKDIPNKSYKISDWWNREKAYINLVEGWAKSGRRPSTEGLRNSKAIKAKGKCWRSPSTSHTLTPRRRNRRAPTPPPQPLLDVPQAPLTPEQRYAKLTKVWAGLNQDLLELRPMTVTGTRSNT
ncbi:uncharacterized protein LOC135928815 [Gordionus sp. m RMFG-2023]|uniref:uncharacterized protein LOC135928815 n=1 Tax=Gordionus sp. m RMFG-2023 TaxID=3053472 RepID=UPI0031FD6131